MSERVSLLHFTTNGFTSALPGVERIMTTQMDLLRGCGVESRIITGETDHPNPDQVGIIVNGRIRSGGSILWESNEIKVDEDGVNSLAKELAELIGDSSPVFHNSTNAARHNPNFGIAAARISQQRALEGMPATVWIHDSRKATPLHLSHFLPTQKAVSLVTVSQIRMQQLIESFDQMRQLGFKVPDCNLSVIYNPIDPSFLEGVDLAPQTLADIAPNFDKFTEDNHLSQGVDEAEEILFGDQTFKFLVPARVVEQKGVERAMRVASEFSKHERTALIVTGPPDFRKPENIRYWEDVKRQADCLNKDGFKAIFMGGIDWRYMPWMYKNSNLLLALFQNEGFGLPPIEAACSGLSSVIFDDPALLETTGGNALVVSTKAEFKPEQIAQKVLGHISSDLPTRFAQTLLEKARRDYSPNAILEQTRKVLGI